VAVDLLEAFVPVKNVAPGELADPSVVAPRATPIRKLMYPAPLSGV